MCLQSLQSIVAALLFTEYVSYDLTWWVWAPAGMGKRGALAPSGNIILSCASVITAKRLINELFMRYFHNMSSDSGGSPPRGLHLWRLLGDFPPQTPHLITPGKKSCGRSCSSHSRTLIHSPFGWIWGSETARCFSTFILWIERTLTMYLSYDDSATDIVMSIIEVTMVETIFAAITDWTAWWLQSTWRPRRSISLLAWCAVDRRFHHCVTSWPTPTDISAQRCLYVLNASTTASRFH